MGETLYKVVAEKTVTHYYRGGNKDTHRLVVVKQDGKFNCLSVSAENEIISLFIGSDASFNTLAEAQKYLSEQSDEINPEFKNDATE